MEALILIDIQNDYFAGGLYPLRGMRKAAVNAARLLEEFRAAGKPVVHIKHVSLKPGAIFFFPDTVGAEINALVWPKDGERVFVKHYPNSFRDTGLGEYLRDLGVTELHLAGAMTNLCVDTTTRAAFDLGYLVKVHGDCCAARGLWGTRLIHRVSLATLGSAFAEIVYG
jgi:nicotinamidase-related amidase